jgi:S-formylglutathione hydrolase
MYSYIVSELPSLLYTEFPLDESRASIMGHSMGGHGALTIFLKNPGLFKSVSAFAPICNPSQCPWGQKAFGGYLEGEGEWKKWDASELVKDWAGEFKALIDVVCFSGCFQQLALLGSFLFKERQGLLTWTGHWGQFL